MRPVVGASLFGGCAAVLAGALALDKPAGRAQDPYVPVPTLTPIPLADQPTTVQDVQVRVAQQVPGFGGLFVDPEEPDRLKVWVKDSSRELEPVRAALSTLIGRYPDFDEDRIDALPGQYGFLELQNWHDRLFQEIASVPGVVSTDVQERINRIQFGVESETVCASVNALVAEQGVPQEAVEIVLQQKAQIDSCQFSNSLQNCRRPLIGGLRIEAVGKGACSLGFMARRNNVQGMVTASHCTPEFLAPDSALVGQPDTDVFQEDHFVGVEEVDPTPFPGLQPTPTTVCGIGFSCRLSDAAWINLTGGNPTPPVSHGWIAHPSEGSPSWDGSTVYAIRDAVRITLIGTEVKKVGERTGLTTGYITATNVNHDRGNGVWLLWQNQASYESLGGDSGSPVFVESANHLDVTLVGLHWGSFPDGGDAVYSDIAYIQQSSDLGLLDVKVPTSGGGGR